MGERAVHAAMLRQPPRRFGRWRLGLCRALEAGAARLGGRALYRRSALAPGRFDVRREVVRVPGLPRGLEGFRIAHLSDLHAGPFLGAGDLGAVVEAVNDARPDLCAITGDFITRDWREALALADDLGALRAEHGTLAVFGNHDYHGREEGRIATALGERGVRFLRNECVRIERAGGALAVVGLEDVEEGRVVDVEGARRALQPGDVELVLCHGPAAAEALARPGCAAILAGHTHGGQVALPLLRRLGPRHPGDRIELGGTALIVSRGLGALVLPLRVRARAEVVLVELEGEGAR